MTTKTKTKNTKQKYEVTIKFKVNQKDWHNSPVESHVDSVQAVKDSAVYILDELVNSLGKKPKVSVKLC